MLRTPVGTAVPHQRVTTSPRPRVPGPVRPHAQSHSPRPQTGHVVSGSSPQRFLQNNVNAQAVSGQTMLLEFSVLVPNTVKTSQWTFYKVKSSSKHAAQFPLRDLLVY